MLRKELEHNFLQINELWPSSGEADEIAPYLHLIGPRCASLSTAVYDDFLPRLDTLNTAEIDAIYDAYELIREAVDAGKRMATSDDRQGAALAVFFTSETLLMGWSARCAAFRRAIRT